MTFIKPHRHFGVLDVIIFLMIAMLGFSAFFLVMFYNRAVSSRHGVDAANVEFQKLQAQSAELQNKAISMFDRTRLDSLVAERSLVREKKPQYLEINPQWLFASGQ